MLIRRTAVLALAFCLALIADSAQSQRRPQPKSSPQQTQQPTPADQRGTEQSPAFIKIIPTPKSDSEAAQEAEDRRNKKSADEWLVRWTGAVAIFTLVLAVIAAWQGIQLRLTVLATKDAAKAAELNAQAVIDAERAHLFIGIERQNVAEIISHAATAAIPNNMEDAQISPLHISYAFQNYGRTPAVLKDIKHGTLIATDIYKVVRDYVAIIDLPSHILGANEKTAPIEVSDVPRLTVSDARAIGGADKTFWFYGIATYDDTFGWRRTLDFIWHYGFDSNGFRIFRYSEKAERIQNED
jgi:hypothetical protein